MISSELKFAVAHGLIDAFRYGSEMFFKVINEARANQQHLDLSADELDFIASDIGKFADYYGEEVALDMPVETDDEIDMVDIFITDEDEGFINAAEYRGKDVELNKPMKGDVKKFKVYVKDPKTGNIRKINFGLNVTRKLLEDPERRAAFTARHNCENAKDKLTPRYWSCRVNLYFSKIFGGKPIGGRYW